MMTKAARDVLAERKRQIRQEGWTTDHDDTHDDGHMAKAAACYAYVSTLPKSVRESLEADPDFHGKNLVITKRIWPWDWKWWKPKTRRQDLVRAGALIVAEIERLDRAEDVETDPRPDRDMMNEIMALIREFWTEEQIGEYLSAEHPQFGMSALEVIAAGRADELLNSLKALSEGAYL